MGISIFCCSFLGLRNFKVKGYYLQNPSKIKDFGECAVKTLCCFGGGSYPHELTKANPIDPQDEEETKDDLEHVPIESNDHYDIDIAEDSMEEDQ